MIGKHSYPCRIPYPMTENQNPEQKARDRIDEQLRQAGWTVQKKIDFSSSQGQAVREWQTEVSPADYVLFIDCQSAVKIGLPHRHSRYAAG